MDATVRAPAHSCYGSAAARHQVDRPVAFCGKREEVRLDEPIGPCGPQRRRRLGCSGGVASRGDGAVARRARRSSPRVGTAVRKAACGGRGGSGGSGGAGGGAGGGGWESQCRAQRRGWGRQAAQPPRRAAPRHTRPPVFDLRAALSFWRAGCCAPCVCVRACLRCD